jgi:glycine betaine/proline transport system ATP-binding protein
VTEQPKISIRNLYKIFGAYPRSMVSKVQGGMGKTELLNKHRHVLGLQEINVDIRDGDITVIMGLSGSGKSTLIRHLNGLIAPTAGEILLDGVNVAGINGAALRELRRFRMSMVFQSFALMPHLRVLHNVEMAQRVRGDSEAAPGGTRSNGWSGSVSRASRTTTRTSSPGACSSAWESPERSRPTRTSCSWMRRFRRSIL